MFSLVLFFLFGVCFYFCLERSLSNTGNISKIKMSQVMAYSIHGRNHCRQEINSGCSMYLTACPECVGTNLPFGRNYLEKNGPFAFFAIKERFQIIDDHKKIRNFCLHEESFVSRYMHTLCYYNQQYQLYNTTRLSTILQTIEVF